MDTSFKFDSKIYIKYQNNNSLKIHPLKDFSIKINNSNAVLKLKIS